MSISCWNSEHLLRTKKYILLTLKVDLNCTNRGILKLQYSRLLNLIEYVVYNYNKVYYATCRHSTFDIIINIKSAGHLGKLYINMVSCNAH